jgi:hypothetical protein
LIDKLDISGGVTLSENVVFMGDVLFSCRDSKFPKNLDILGDLGMGCLSADGANGEKLSAAVDFLSIFFR